MVYFLTDVVEFKAYPNVRLAGGRAVNLNSAIKAYRPKTGLPTGKVGGKHFAFTNKQFINELEKNKRLAKNEDYLSFLKNKGLSYTDAQLIDSHKNVGYTNPDGFNLRYYERQKVPRSSEVKLNRMGNLKLRTRLPKIEAQPLPQGTKRLTRYIDVKNEELPDFLKQYKKKGASDGVYSETRDGKIRFRNPVSTAADDKLTDEFKRTRTGYTKVKYNIKPSKKSSGRYIGAYDRQPYESEYLYPANSSFKVKKVKNRNGIYEIDLKE
jgi:hypothetical protein